MNEPAPTPRQESSHRRLRPPPGQGETLRGEWQRSTGQRVNEDDLRRQGFRRGLGASLGRARPHRRRRRVLRAAQMGGPAPKPAAAPTAAVAPKAEEAAGREEGTRLRGAGQGQAGSGGNARRHRRAIAEAQRRGPRLNGAAEDFSRREPHCWPRAIRISPRVSTTCDGTEIQRDPTACSMPSSSARRSARRAIEGRRDGAARRSLRRCARRPSSWLRRSIRTIKSPRGLEARQDTRSSAGVAHRPRSGRRRKATRPSRRTISARRWRSTPRPFAPAKAWREFRRDRRPMLSRARWRKVTPHSPRPITRKRARHSKPPRRIRPDAPEIAAGLAPDRTGTTHRRDRRQVAERAGSWKRRRSGPMR